MPTKLGGKVAGVTGAIRGSGKGIWLLARGVRVGAPKPAVVEVART